MRAKASYKKVAAWLISASLISGLFLFSISANKAAQSATQILNTDDICIVAPATSFDPNWGIALYAPRKVPADARCPVCGMYPSKSLDWAGQVIFKNGDTHFFDSPLSLFIYMQSPERYNAARRISDIAVSFVTDSSSGLWIKTENAFFVSGSNAKGPMRAGNFVAFADKEIAKKFIQTRGGTVLRAQQIEPQLLLSLNSSRRHQHTQSTTSHSP